MPRLRSATTIVSVVVLALGAGMVRAQEPSGLEAAKAIQQTIVGAIARAEKSVVAIARVRKEQAGETFSFEFRPDPFGRRMTPAAALGPTDPDFVPNEYGTGVVVDRRGLILTAYHVLSPDSEYYVTTQGRRVYHASIKGADPRSDLAVLSVDAADLEPITFGDARQLRKGQIVIALGNPYAIGRDGQASASWGIVSNLARKTPPIPEDSGSLGQHTLHSFGTLIQTDARLNQGTSGGALLNLQGEMVGLIVAVAATAGYEQAAGYAIPLDATFRRVIETLKQGREVEYGFLGVRPVNLKPEEILQGRHGIRVQGVVPGTPAERYGLKPDDLITAVNGTRIYGCDGLMLEVGRLPAEAVALFGVDRGKQRLQLKVTLAKYPVVGRKVITTPAPSWRGMRIDFATAAVDSEGSGSGRGNLFEDGVIVTEVEKGKPAWNAGLRPGMLIRQVDRTPVHTPREFRAAVSDKSGPVQLRLANARDDQPVRTVGPES